VKAVVVAVVSDSYLRNLRIELMMDFEVLLPPHAQEVVVLAPHLRN
jgi:hypothetical protein